MPAGSLEKHLGFQQARAQPHAQVLRACMPGGGNLGLCRKFLAKAEFKKFWHLAQDAMKEYQWLNAWSANCGRSSFHIVIKHHAFLHLAKDAWYLNPRVFWCFKAEDYVGHISTVTHSVSMGVKATKISQKLAIKYRILLHLLCTRPGFHLQTSVE